MTPLELPAYLRSIAQRAESKVPVNAANAMAQTYQSSVVRSMTGSAPSAPGTPPARRTGTLARSVRAEPAVPSGAGRATSSVAPHTVYARIQQLGGTIHVKRARVLTDGKHFYGKQVTLPARPYMVMTDERRTECHNAAATAITGVISG